jgi:hypothetical protein
MAKSTIDKQVAAAQKRLSAYINELAEKALAETKQDFADARIRLGIK